MLTFFFCSLKIQLDFDDSCDYSECESVEEPQKVAKKGKAIAKPSKKDRR